MPAAAMAEKTDQVPKRWKKVSTSEAGWSLLHLAEELRIEVGGHA